MRPVLGLLLTLILVAPVTAQVDFLRVWPAWHDAESFDRIGEYFGSGENQSREIVRRTRADARAGFYFLVRVKSATAVPAGKFELNVIAPDQPEPKTFAFPVAVGTKESVFQLGLTGADWPGGKLAHPVAWRIALLDPEGRVLTEQKSFLWEKPAK